VSVEAVQQRLEARPPVEAGPVEVDTGTAGRRQVARAGAQAAAAQRLAGRLVERKFKDPATGRGRLYRGVLEFQGPDSGPHYFVAAYEDGDRQRMSLAMAQRYLLPEGEEMPAAPVAAAVELQLPPPEPWDLGQPEQFRAVLQHLMPGSWEARWATRVAGAVAAVAAAAVRGQPLPIVCTTDAEVEFLLSRVLLQQCQLVLEPFAGAGTITRVLCAAGCPRVFANDLSVLHPADAHLDACQPASYAALERLAGAPIDAIVTSPWFSVLDVALPLLVDAARVVACVHVPGHYLSSGPLPRFAYLQSLQRQGRLLILYGLPRGPTGWRCAWLVVFRSAAIKRALLLPGFRRLPGLVLE
jgi:hypothetical protein